MPHALVIDDSRAMRILLRDALRGIGYDVDEAENGSAANFRLVDGTARDVALVDWNMPVMNGLEFIRAVRADSRFRGMRLLVITSETEADQVLTALAAGADEYLMKPFTHETLIGKLEMLGLVRQERSGMA
jgi:two-component system chemotaxis response regulator CheY